LTILLFLAILNFTNQTFLSANLIPNDGELPVIGSQYGGGTVFYILQEGDYGYEEGKVKGLIASDNDVLYKHQWGANVTFVDETEEGIGFGLANTERIVDALGVLNSAAGYSEYAANKCLTLNRDGYSDWYLPSKEELRKLFDNKKIIPNLVDGHYWSSTERMGVNFDEVYMLNFGGLNSKGSYYTSKAQVLNIRPIRTLSIDLRVNNIVITSSNNGGLYNSPQEVILNTTKEGADIRYTLDGTEPTETSNLYDGKVIIDKDTTLKARAYKEGMQSSDILEVEYIIDLPKASFRF
jgi:hypothetical protein